MALNYQELSMDYRSALEVAGILVFLLVAYASFWVLVILFVAYVLYQVVSQHRE